MALNLPFLTVLLLNRYLDTKNVGGPNLDGLEGPPVISIGPLAIEKVLAIDETTFTALQIFSSTSGPAGARSGSWSKRREGLSVFSLLNRCRSLLGARYMRHLCRCPSRRLDMIHRRQEAVAYLAHPAQTELANTLRALLGAIKNVPHLLKKLTTTQVRLLFY